MRLIDLTIEEFEEFSSTHPLRNYKQTSSYARFLGERGFSYDYIGLVDGDVIVAASLIVYKKVDRRNKIAYAPKGFLIDYLNTELLRIFNTKLIERFQTRNIVFIKVNPEIIISEYILHREDDFKVEHNKNVNIIDTMKNIKFRRRKENYDFELLEPRVSAYIDLKKFDKNKLTTNAKENIYKSQHRGLIFEIADSKDINHYFKFIENDSRFDINYYRRIINVFKLKNMVDLILIKVDFRKFLEQAKTAYEEETENNINLNLLIKDEPSPINMQKKMDSDKLMLELKNVIVLATEGLKHNEVRYVAGGIAIKYSNRVSIISAGYDPEYQNLYPEYFLFNTFVDLYKNYFDYIDLRGVITDFDKSSPYYKSTLLKLEFMPDIYEHIGEFDLIIDVDKFNKLNDKNLIAPTVDSLR